MEIQSVGSFDDKEKCREFAPKIVEALMKLTDLPKENIHLLLKPVARHEVVMNGAILG